MYFYYLQGKGLSISKLPEAGYLAFAIMGLAAITAGFAVSLYLLRKWREKTWGWCQCSLDISGKVVVITGGNSGLGLETARGLAQRGALVIIGCRSSTRAQQAIDDIRSSGVAGDLVFLELDLLSSDSIRLFVSRLLTKFPKIDVLINNAGVYYPPQDPPLTNDEGVEIHFAVNHLGHFLLTHLLTDTLADTPHSRILIVSSELYKSGRLDTDNLLESGPPTSRRGTRQPLYNNSKLANLLHARELHRRLKGRGVMVCALSPGFVYTGLFRHSLEHYGWLKKMAFLPVAFLFMRSATQGAQTSIHCACSPSVSLDRGRVGVPYYQNCREMALLPLAEDDALARRLWDASLRMLGLQ